MSKHRWANCEICDKNIRIDALPGDVVMCEECRADMEAKAMKNAAKFAKVQDPTLDPTDNCHYRAMVMQPIDFIRANKLRFEVGNIVKYVTRYPYKGGLKDLYKALDYLNMLIEEEKRKCV